MPLDAGDDADDGAAWACESDLERLCAGEADGDGDGDADGEGDRWGVALAVGFGVVVLPGLGTEARPDVPPAS